MTVEDLTFDVEQHIDMKATPEKAFAAVLHRLGKGNTRPDGQSLEMCIRDRHQPVRLRIRAGQKIGR